MKAVFINNNNKIIIIIIIIIFIFIYIIIIIIIIIYNLIGIIHHSRLIQKLSAIPVSAFYTDDHKHNATNLVRFCFFKVGASPTGTSLLRALLNSV